MKILALVEDLRVNKTSAGICNSRILMSLVNEGHQITCLYDYFDDDNFPWLASKNINFVRVNLLEENKAITLFKKSPKANAFPAYTTGFNFDELRKIKSWKNTIKKALKNNFDLIFVLGAGNSNLNFFAIKNVKTNIPYIVNYHDPYPIHQYPKPYAKPSSHVGRLKAKQSNRVMSKAFKVSFPSLRLFEWMNQFHPQLSKKSFILPHVFTKLKNLNSLESDKLVYLDTTKLNILHVGSLLGPRNPKTLFKVFNKFIKEDQEREKYFFLNIIGSVANENKAFDKNLNLLNINLVKERVSYAKSIELLKQTDIVLILEANSKNNPFMPGKLADCISANKPIMALTNENSETTRILKDNFSLTTNLDNENEIYNILEKLWLSWKKNTLQTLINKELFYYISSDNFNTIINQQTQCLK
ncbi:hypothetical protein [Polaribacter aestuariivivens]|uniref:hypothetical protein n=1 Tax=Polaribacter aestuariivivens TaxID=2304626 RepID=UPI003F4971D3